MSSTEKGTAGGGPTNAGDGRDESGIEALIAEMQAGCGYDDENASIGNLINYKNALEDRLREVSVVRLNSDRLLSAAIEVLEDRTSPVSNDEVSLIDRGRWWEEVGGPAVDWLENHITAQDIERRELLRRLARGSYSLEETQMFGEVVGLEGLTAAEVEDAAVVKLRELYGETV